MSATSSAETAARPVSLAGGRVGFRRAALHLGGLWAMAFVQPLFAILGDSAEFFVARASTTSDIVAFALAYCLLPPVGAAGVVWAAGRVRPVLGWALQLVLVGVLAAAFVLPPLGDLLAGSATAVGVALLVGATVAALYARAGAVHAFLTVLSPAPLVFLALFLVVSPVSELVWRGDASGSVTGPSRSSTPIVHVVLDELPVTTLERPDGSFESELFPQLARLVAGATWYRNATTEADETADAVPLQLTGDRPEPGALPTAHDHPRSLFTLFARSHDMTVVEPITDVCPEQLCAKVRPPAGLRLRALGRDLRVVAEHLLLPDDLRDGLPPIDETWAGFADAPAPAPTDAELRHGRDELLERVLARLRTNDSRAGFARVAAALDGAHARPPLLFLHSTLPHAPWRFLPDGREYTVRARTTPGLGEAWASRQWLVDQAFQRHVLQVQAVDAMLGRLLGRLRSTGLYDRAVIVVTADHGASFLAGEPRRWVNKRNLPQIAAVPFIVKYPGQHDARVDDRAVRTSDVLPTIARAAGLRMPWRTHGVPAGERPLDRSTPIDVARADEPGATLPLAAVLAGRRRRDAIEARLLRSGVYAMGPRPGLVGRRSAGIPAANDARAFVDAADEYRSIAPGAPVVPAFVSGTADGLADGSVVAVAVNGRIEATTRVHRGGSAMRFAAIVRPESLRPGANRIAVLGIDGDRMRTLATVG
ncbi:MAG TPA: sulfatase-like hydrolase/transferase [Solirubrobacteraceae bacterium]|nr:sulfatase-like hydrolase/transferase [Solirubrobacteraceae bacterium]